MSVVRQIPQQIWKNRLGRMGVRAGHSHRGRGMIEETVLMDFM